MAFSFHLRHWGVAPQRMPSQSCGQHISINLLTGGRVVRLSEESQAETDVVCSAEG